MIHNSCSIIITQQIEMNALPLLLLLVMHQKSAVSQLSYERIYPPLNETDETTHVYLGLIVSFGDLFNSSGNVAGVRVALDSINSNEYLLQNYTLHYVLSDSQCNRTVASKVFLEQMLNRPTKLALIGAGCSVASEPTAELSSFFNITQLSCSTASHKLADRRKFPYYFQLLPSIADIAQVYDVISNEFRWKHIIFIVQNENLFTVKLDKTRELLEKRGVTYSVNLFETDAGITSLERDLFTKPNERVFVIASYEKHALQLLCAAYENRIMHLTPVLITYQWYRKHWWRNEDVNVSCTVEQRELVLNNSLAVNFIVSDLIKDVNSTTMGISGQEYLEQENILRSNFGKNLFSQYCFDAVWTLAYALNKTLNDVSADPNLGQGLAAAYGDPAEEFKLDTFKYNSSLLVHTIYDYLSSPEQAFKGVTGDVSFDGNGIRIANLLSVYQYRFAPRNGDHDLNWFEVGRIPVNESTGLFFFEYFNNESVTNLWPDGLPSDGVIQQIVSNVFIHITVIFSILATLGVIFSIVCFVFNFTFRTKMLIRLTSPKLNYFITFGAFLYFVDVYFYVLPTTDQQVYHAKCSVTTWLTALGYSFTFGPIVAKMFRVWFIFRKPALKKEAVHDWKLAVGVLLLAGIDLLILIVYNAIDVTNTQNSTKLIQSKDIPTTEVNGVPTVYVFYICDSTIQDIVVGISFGYKCLIQVMAILLAFLTRKVKVKGLDDSKYIAAVIYITSIVLAVIFISSYTLKEFVNVFAAVISAGILVAASCVLALVFIPKMIGVYRDPKGENVFARSEPTSVRDTITIENNNTIDESVQSLKLRVHELESILSQQSKSARS